MPRQLSRLAFLGAAVSAAAAPRALAAAPSDDDLATLRLLIAGELLAIDFYGGRGKTLGRPAGTALADERAHYDALSQLLAAGGGTPLTADDVDFSYPRGGATSLALRIERLLTGAYVGAAARVQTTSYRLALTQIAATEAQHAGLWLQREALGPFGPTFAPALTEEQASDELAVFES